MEIVNPMLFNPDNNWIQRLVDVARQPEVQNMARDFVRGAGEQLSRGLRNRELNARRMPNLRRAS
jgi:hypothetical protein